MISQTKLSTHLELIMTSANTADQPLFRCIFLVGRSPGFDWPLTLSSSYWLLILFFLSSRLRLSPYFFLM